MYNIEHGLEIGFAFSRLPENEQRNVIEAQKKYPRPKKAQRPCGEIGERILIHKIESEFG